MITQKELKELLHYDPDTGVFIRIKRTSNSVRVGETAGSNHNKGYRIICLPQGRYLSHRLAWLYVYGALPINIDHINKDKLDNRICNLREASVQENAKNMKRSIRNTSGAVGVCWYSRDKKWQSSITVYYKKIHLGFFDSKVDAVKARKDAEKTYGFHVNHGGEA